MNRALFCSKIRAATVACVFAAAVSFAQPPLPTVNVNVAPEVCTQTVSLAWDAPVTNDWVAGYKVYWGYDSRRYVQAQDCGSNTFAVLVPVCTFRTVYFAVTAYDTNMMEGPLSEEVILPKASGTNYTIVSTSLEVADSPAGPWREFAALPVCVLTNRSYPTNLVAEPARFYRSLIAVQQTQSPP